MTSAERIIAKLSPLLLPIDAAELRVAAGALRRDASAFDSMMEPLLKAGRVPIESASKIVEMEYGIACAALSLVDKLALSLARAEHPIPPAFLAVIQERRAALAGKINARPAAPVAAPTAARWRHEA